MTADFTETKKYAGQPLHIISFVNTIVAFRSGIINKTKQKRNAGAHAFERK